MLAVDRPLDMYRAAVNVFSDSCGAATIARPEGEEGNRDRSAAAGTEAFRRKTGGFPGGGPGTTGDANGAARSSSERDQPGSRGALRRRGPAGGM